MNKPDLTTNSHRVIKPSVERILSSSGPKGTEVRVELSFRSKDTARSIEPTDWRILHGRYLASLDMVQTLFENEHDMQEAVEEIGEEVARSRAAFFSTPTDDPRGLLAKVEMLLEGNGPASLIELPSDLVAPVIDDARRILEKQMITHLETESN